ncbi:methionine ABC transporter ATP-binding protein [Bullifex porci]|uniref:Methionine ABC transporter ATP-binding protein n=1 Tax=Bullifex porci TaxID=2606638 RepID=A0A7X2TPI8_9SPIO|nr:methionine ABC transporter ATP-binding protein [Bullifex porci]MDD7255853.1 methionine ABC transporter ATP-binding protein [Bullifex porci]MDD7587999.1 methionine ABC transporter ATP-binding protein [Bullifex porci]MDY2740830.1 methionine ABC transporter ATP-binding protein [Bullifex porci]MSU05449.1 methionine ABC transporter ATP-binding protein [Bullifex porci]
MKITLKNLKRDYGTLHAVQDVSLTIPSNKIYGIIGRSGAGKSTLVRLISMLEKPDSGEVWYDEERVDNLSKKELIAKRRRIGMIFQNFNLFSSRNALENIAYPMEICHMEKGYIKKRSEELLALVGLEGRGDAPISTLSGGQKQRVAIARALAVQPDILFCDEATSALDPQTTRAILALIKEIQKKMNLTVVMITHQMEVVRDACDFVAVLDSGRVVEEGKVSEVFASPVSDVTKDFLSTGTNMSQSVVRWSQEPGHYTLRFRGQATDEPIISSVTKETGALFNIRAAGVQTVNGEEMGIMALDIGPNEEVAKKAIEKLKEGGISVEVVK